MGFLETEFMITSVAVMLTLYVNCVLSVAVVVDRFGLKCSGNWIKLYLDFGNQIISKQQARSGIVFTQESDCVSLDKRVKSYFKVSNIGLLCQQCLFCL